MSDKRKRRVLLTGAAGFVAGILRQHWGDRYRLRMADIKPISHPGEHEVVQADIAHYDQMRRACERIDTIVHLAADPRGQAEFYKTLLPLNVTGAYNAFHAGHDAGCRRIVFSSSVNAVLGYQGERGPLTGMRPSFRSTSTGPPNSEERPWRWSIRTSTTSPASASAWAAPIFNRTGTGIRTSRAWASAPETPHSSLPVVWMWIAIVHGVSRHRRSWLDLEHTCNLLGYESQDGTAFKTQGNLT